MPFPSEDDRLVGAAFQIIDSSVDQEAIFDEACSLSKRIKLQCDKSHSAQLDISVDNFLSVTCQEHQRQSRSSRGDIHPIPIFAKQIIELSKSCSQSNVPLLTPDVRDKFEAVLALLKLKTEDVWYDNGLLQSFMSRHSLPLEMLWRLHKIGAMCLDSYFSSKLNEDSSFVERFSRELIACCRGSVESFSSRRKILTSLTGYFVKKAFGDEKSTLKRSYIHLLDNILEGVLDLKLPADEIRVLALPTDFLNYQEILPKETLKRFCVHALSYILSCKADCDVTDVLKDCSDWKSVEVFGAARELCRQLFVPVSCEEVTFILLQSFDQMKVSSIVTMIFLSALYSTFQEASRVMNGHIKLKLSEGLESSNAVKLSAAFLLVRQSAAAGCEDAPIYSSWFETTFGDSRCSLTSTRSTFTSLMRFLSSLVPFESAEYLKVHIFRRPAAPAKCRNLYDDYVALAKTRLEDLKVPLQDLSKGIYNSSSASTDGSNIKVINQAEEDVERAVKTFTETGKLPTAIIEASIFRKPYFIGKFLPALLKSRYLPDIPDQRMKLISEIHNAGKIPPSVYNTYLQECEKEKQALLQGVFDVDDDYELEEMVLPPFRQLSLRLDSYVKVVSTGNQDKVAESLKQVVDKVRSLLATASAEGTFCDGSVVVDLVQSPHDDVFIQIVSEVMCHICTLIEKWSKLDVRESSVRCLVAVHTLITGLCQAFSNLKPAFYLHLLLYLESQDVQSVSGVATAATVCACLMTSPSPLNVKHKGHAVQKSYKNILEAVLECLRLNIKSDLEHILRFLLEYVAAAFDLQDSKDDEDCVIEVGPPTGAETHLLPGHVVKQINLLCRRYTFVKRRQHEARFTALNSGSVRMCSVMSDHCWEDLCKQHQYSLSDWIQFELAVQTQRDLLFASEREEFFTEMSKFFIEKPNQATDPALFCSEVLKILAALLGQTSRNIHTDGDTLPENVMYFVSLLRNHLMSLPCSDAASMSWLAATLDSADVLPCKSALLRLVVELPPLILFGNSSSEISSHVNSAIFVIDHLVTSRSNQGGYFSQKATIFIAQGIIWAQQSSKYTFDVGHVITHPFVLTSILAHREILEEKGLFRELSPGWTSQLTTALQWAERFVESGDGSVAQEAVEVRQQAAALVVVLLRREHHVDLQLNVVTPGESVFICFLELSLACLISQSLCCDSDRHSVSLLASAVVQILRATGDLLVQLLDTGDPSLCQLRQDLGLGKHPMAAFWRDFHILRLAAQIPVQVILHSTCRNVTLAVVNAYIRVLQYVCDSGTRGNKCLDEMVYSNISAWIKRMVDHTKGDHLQEINNPEAEVCEADLLLFRYMEEKKKGWV